MDENTVLTAGQFDNTPLPTEEAPLTEVAESAGTIAEQPTTPVIDQEVIGTPQASAGRIIPEAPSASQSRVSASTIPSAIADSTEVDAVSQRLESLIGQGVGRTSETARQTEAAGIEGFEQDIADINAEIGIERAALKQTLVDNTGREQGQFSRRARGEAARANAQSAATIEALSAASAAASGNLTVAENSVKRAVDAKFGPIEEEIAAQLNILQLRKDTMTREERKLAETREEALNAQQRGFEIQKTLLAANMAGVTAAIKDGRITPSEGASINGRLVAGDNSGLSEIPALGGGSNDEARIDLRKTVRGEKAYGTFSQVINGYDNVEVGATLNNAQGDLAIVNGIAKMLDPDGVVRPAEFDTVEEAQGFMDRFLNIGSKIASGDRLRGNVRQDFLDAADALLKQKGAPVRDSLLSVYETPIKNAGLEIDDVIPEVGLINQKLETIENRASTRTPDNVQEEEVDEVRRLLQEATGEPIDFSVFFN